MQHIMLDLETWSTQTNALIIGIGAAKFDPVTLDTTDTMLIWIDPEDAQRFKFHIDAGTVLWWMAEERTAAREQFLNAEKHDIGTALEGFHMWVGDDRDTQMWGNGAAFDNVILRNAYTTLSVPVPWNHWSDRCYRTVKNRFGAPRMAERLGEYHTPMDDAISQVAHLKLIRDTIGEVL